MYVHVTVYETSSTIKLLELPVYGIHKSHIPLEAMFTVCGIEENSTTMATSLSKKFTTSLQVSYEKHDRFNLDHLEINCQQHEVTVVTTV